MPIYEYKCLNCGNQLEIMQRISEDSLTECPRCSGRLEKQWSLSGFQFKGSGWYVSDYGNRGSDVESKAESGTEVKSESPATESGSSEKKSASNESKVESPKTSASNESTVGSSGASQPASKVSEDKPIAKTD